MVDCGGWVPKRFSDFAQNFFRLSSSDINLFVFGKIVTSFFPIGKKSDYSLKILKFWFKIRIGRRPFFGGEGVDFAPQPYPFSPVLPTIYPHIPVSPVFDRC